jgi:hypothetical protein
MDTDYGWHVFEVVVKVQVYCGVEPRGAARRPISSSRACDQQVKLICRRKPSRFHCSRLGSERKLMFN